MSFTATTFKTLIATATVGLAVSATGAQAYGDKRIDAIQARESGAIEQNRLNGQLTGANIAISRPSSAPSPTWKYAPRPTATSRSASTATSARRR